MSFPMVELGEVCDVIAGQSPPGHTYNREGAGLPFFQGKTDFGEFYPVPRMWCTEPNKVAVPGDLLISVRAPVGPTNLCNTKACIGRGIAAIRPSPRIEVRYLMHWMRSIEPKVAALGRGSTFEAISKSDLVKIQVPLPPLPTQRRIAGILDKAQALVANDRRTLALYDQLAKSVFLEMFGDANPEVTQWPLVTIADLVSAAPNSLRSGPFGSDLLHSEFVEEGVAVLGIDNAVNNKFSWKGRRFITPQKYADLKRYTVRPGDVLVTIMATIGRTAVVPDDIGPAINSKHLAAITLDQSKARPSFISFSIHSDERVVNQLFARSRGAIMSGLNLTLIKEVKLHLPPIRLQKKFENTLKGIEEQRTQAESSLRRSEGLFGSLLAGAFSGELGG